MEIVTPSSLAAQCLLAIGQEGVSLTPKGDRYVQRELIRSTAPKHWDKKWRIVIFDIPEKRKAKRHILRDSLIKIGFIKLQQSVWIYPYDCEELVVLLKADFQLGKEALYLIVDTLENDSSLKMHFHLT